MDFADPPAVRWRSMRVVMKVHARHAGQPRRVLRCGGVGLLIATLVLPAHPVAAAQPADDREMAREARERYDEGDALLAAQPEAAAEAFLAAGRKYADAAKTIASAQPSGRVTPSLLSALKALERSAEAAPQQTFALAEAIALCDWFLALLEREAGPSVLGEARYTEIVARRDVYRTQLAEREAPTPAPPVEPPPVLEPPTPAVDKADATDERPPPPARTWPRAAFGASVALAAAFGAAALGTGLVRMRAPFRGSAYDSVIDAASATWTDDDPTNNVGYGPNSDVCRDGPALDAGVAQACQRHTTLGRASLATGLLSGAFLVASAVFLGFMVRSPKKAQRTSAMRRHDLRLDVMRISGGVMLGGVGRF